MSTRRQVRCIKKHEHHNPHERITHIGGDGWKLTESEALAAMAAGDTFYVSVGGQEVRVVRAEHEGRPYLKTEPDGYAPNNLLSLPECVSGGHGGQVTPPGPPQDVPRRDRHDRPAQPDRGHA